ncbi:hypothetical protein RclHR1_16160002 [Rhizophagus clarus]|uniref:Uncharacterized protein n=1 Tax=Rhizophagus clarus TaxID=94130 RepID=A0A2Z6R9R2_9GLOM|nr:hypothetical protein RclHR1_16160002 [Rhizophagus clarus]GES89601.1 hypothetical protein GLOIN_2v1871772 [Rhizophagus clarus]
MLQRRGLDCQPERNPCSMVSYLSKKKQQEKFQAVVYNLPEDMTDASLFPNGRPHQFLLDSGIKSFKIVKEVDGSRKLIGYFDTWDHVSTRINNP